MLIIHVVFLCALFFIVCVLSTGTDEKNLKQYRSYPDEVQERILQIDRYRKKIKKPNVKLIWLANFLIFSILFLLLGLGFRQPDFMHNFIYILILGETLNFFDLIVIDLLWWRNTKRIRLSEIPEKELYQNPKKHIDAFLRALILYFLIALLDGYLLTIL